MKSIKKIKNRTLKIQKSNKKYKLGKKDNLAIVFFKEKV